MASRRSADWRECADYSWLAGQDRSAWAWEWLRRDPRYRAAALQAIGARSARSATGGDRQAEAWGLHRFEDPRRDARCARPVWTAAAWPEVLRLDARPAQSAVGFDIIALGPASLVTGSNRVEHWLAFDQGHALRMDVVAGTLTRGPARLWLELQGPREIRSAIAALRRLAGLWRGRTVAAADRPSPARAARLIRLLRVADALSAGASQRAIAEVLFDRQAREPRWRIERASVRLQAQRVVRNARAMADGGYRRILSGTL